jgi:hypothetical protein
MAEMMSREFGSSTPSSPWQRSSPPWFSCASGQWASLPVFVSLAVAVILPGRPAAHTIAWAGVGTVALTAWQGLPASTIVLTGMQTLISGFGMFAVTQTGKHGHPADRDLRRTAAVPTVLRQSSPGESAERQRRQQEWAQKHHENIERIIDLGSRAAEAVFHKVRSGSSGAHSTGQREVQFEPVSQVVDLAIHGGGHGPVEGHVLVDRVDPQHPGFAVGGGVELSHQPVAVQDR